MGATAPLARRGRVLPRGVVAGCGDGSLQEMGGGGKKKGDNNNGANPIKGRT